jgi:hypothetical protein
LTGADIVVTNSASPISFQTEGGGAWKIWDRYIALDGQRAFHIGNVCGTCQFLFERLGGANRSVDVGQVVSQLNHGVTQPSRVLLDALKEILPDGRYRAVLLRAEPQLVYPGGPGDYFATEQVATWGVDAFWGLPHHPRTEYYRLGSRRLADHQALHEFLVPTFPHGWLERDQLDAYAAALRNGALPTALALSVLDVKEPAVRRGESEIASHWCLAHYLIDGHHKVFAASQAGMPCTLLSFLALDQGISSAEEVATLRGILEG